MRLGDSISYEGLPPVPPGLEGIPGAAKVLHVLEIDHEFTDTQKVIALRLAWDGFFGESRPHHALWPVAQLLLEAVQGLPCDNAASALSAAFQHVAVRASVEVL
jgi:hypothetical protein